MITTEELEDVVIRTIAEACGSRPVEITRDTDLLELGIDSLGLTAVAAHIQGQCGIPISDLQVLDIMQARIVADVVSVIAQTPTA